ncbi:putative reverse transcriptase [Operophtera brumata]|uniref:Putative reverse transcriptase n=1 Tax=Operophtera brumata TaxID=104452 RepID=A0A0L7K5A6_OPEBR|nr:putative reverse transcriptase [Operophtera brumata]
MNKTIRSGARDIIYKVFTRCLAEYQAGTLLAELEDVYKRTEYLTGKSESTIRRIVKEGKKTVENLVLPPSTERVDLGKCWMILISVLSGKKYIIFIQLRKKSLHCQNC